MKSDTLNHPKTTSIIFFYLALLIGIEATAQQTEIVDFLRVEASVGPDISDKSFGGQYSVTFKMLKSVDSVYLDAINIKLTDILSTEFQISASAEKVWFINAFEEGEIYEGRFWYKVYPKQALYFTGEQVWTQGQGKYTSHWLPSIDDMNEKIEFDLQLLAPTNKSVISNGRLLTIENIHDVNAWRFDMNRPMSSYLVAFAIGEFDKKAINSDSGVPIELYFKTEDSLKAEPTYRHTKEIFDFLEEEIGIPYPWQNYKQVPIRDFLYAGMENTTSTFFSEAFVIDSIGFNDRNYVNVNAHELAHHWFGNLITEVSGEHHWLQEGFATYYALLAEKEIFGEDYYFWKLYQSAEQLIKLSNEGKGESLLNPKSSSLTFYEKGAWALVLLREKVGDLVFRTAIQNYLKKYEYKNVNTEHFLSEVEHVYGGKLSDFKSGWLEQTAFKGEEAYQYLLESPFIKKYFEVSSLRGLELKDKLQLLENALSKVNEFIGQEVVYQLEDEAISTTLELYKKAFETKNVFIRQAIALTLFEVPLELKQEYETLLKDKSYVTQEAALGTLWINFPENRVEYLEIMKDVEGFQNKNIRQLWLYLALVTENYLPYQKERFLSELKDYSSLAFSFEIREKAFEYINFAHWWDVSTLANLVTASLHHNWRFKKSSRTILSKLIEDVSYKDQLLSLSKNMNRQEAEFINNFVK